MKLRKTIAPILSLIAASIFSLTGCISANNPQDDPIKPDPKPETHSWTHFKKKEATPSENGIREYWINEKGDYTFSKPDSEDITNSLKYDTSSFKENDPRYIFYLDDTYDVYYLDIDKKYDYSQASLLAGYKTLTLPENLGETIRTEFTRGENSPYYLCNCTKISDVISNNADLEALQNRISISGDSGYYIFTHDLNSPNTSVSNSYSSVRGFFSGFIEGNGHTIKNPQFDGNRMLGTLLNASIKNLTFTNISQFSVLANEIKDSTLENVNFYLGDATQSKCSGGLICNSISGNTKISNCYIDFGEYSTEDFGGTNFITPIAYLNNASIGNDVFNEVSIRCLDSVLLFIEDTYNRNLRPLNGVSYETSFYFIKNGVLNYQIKYIFGDENILKAATFLKDAIFEVTKKTAQISSILKTDVVPTSQASIVVGSDESLHALNKNLPQNDGDYQFKTFGKAIYINAKGSSAYQTAVLKFVEKMFNYYSVAKNISTYKVDDINNVKLINANYASNSPFQIRRCDWGDVEFIDEYKSGFSSAGYTNSDVYIDVPACDSSDPYFSSSARSHTTLYLLYPGKYLSSHSSWYATNANGSNYPKTNNSYFSWQLCFTCHGNQTEYQNMVNEMAKNIVNVYKSSTNKNANILNLSVMDSNNKCKCSSCQQAESKYGAASGAMIKFTNDVIDKVNSSLGTNNLIISPTAYMQYRDAPIISNKATITSSGPVVLAPIQANYTFPLNDIANNSEAYNLIEDWSKVGEISTWLYGTNFTAYLFPYNSFEASGKTIQYLSNKKVKVCYIQGQHNLRPQRRTGFNDLKIFLNGMFMNDPNSDYYELLDIYFNGYFKEASSKMRKFFDEVVERSKVFETNSYYKSILRGSDNKDSLYSHLSDGRLWDKNQCETWLKLCDEAITLVSNSEIIKNIQAESLFPRYCLCESLASNYSSSVLRQMRLEFKSIADSLNVTYYGENTTYNTLSSIYNKWGI